jgi:hypothetical protein
VAAATEAHFDQTFDVNVKGLFFTVQKALPLFDDGGSIILTSSVSNVLGLPGFSTYEDGAADEICALAEKLGFSPINLGGLSEGGLLVQARGDSWGRLVFKDLVKFDG